MPRKHFSKFLPTQDAVKSNRYLGVFGRWLRHPNLWHLNRRSVAGGAAIGTLCGVIPGPFQMVAAALLAVLFRMNLPVAAAATWYTNPLTIVPIYFVAFKLGAWLTGEDSGIAAPPAIEWNLAYILDWFRLMWLWFADMGKPLAVGLVAVGAILAVLVYVVIRLGWRWYLMVAWQRRARARSLLRREQ